MKHFYYLIALLALFTMLVGCTDKINDDSEQDNNNEVVTEEAPKNNLISDEELKRLKEENEKLLVENKRLKEITDIPSDRRRKRADKYFFGWLEVTSEVDVFKDPYDNSNVIHTINDEMVFAYESLFDPDGNWLLVSTDEYAPIIGYIREGDYLNNNIVPSNVFTSNESLGGIKLGDYLKKAINNIDMEYVKYDFLDGTGLIYPYPEDYDYTTNNKSMRGRIKIFTIKYTDIINMISVNIPGFPLESGIEVGDPKEAIIDLYSEYETETVSENLTLIKAYTSYGERITFKIDSSGNIAGIVLTSSDYSYMIAKS